MAHLVSLEGREKKHLGIKHYKVLPIFFFKKKVLHVKNVPLLL